METINEYENGYKERHLKCTNLLVNNLEDILNPLKSFLGSGGVGECQCEESV